MLKCQVTYLYRRRCPHPTFGASDQCRWHLFASNLNELMGVMPKGAANSAMGAVGFQFAIAAFALWQNSEHPHLFWLFATLLTAGSSLKFFSESVIALEYPLSRLPLWPKAVLVASSCELLASAGMMLSLASQSQSAARYLLDATGSAGWGFVGLLVVAGYSVAMIGGAVSMFERASFKAGKMLRAMVGMAKLGLFASAVGSVSRVLFPSMPTWRAPAGEQQDSSLVIAALVAFLINEATNVVVRKRNLTRDQFAATVVASYPICWLPAFAGPWLAWYLAARVGVHAPLVQAMLAVATSGLATYFATRWLVHFCLRTAYEDDHFQSRFGST